MLASDVRREREVTSSLTSPPISTTQGAMDIGQCVGHDQLVLPSSAGSLSPSLGPSLSSPQSQTHGQPRTPAMKAPFATCAGKGEPGDAKIKGASFIRREMPPLPVDEASDRAVTRRRRSAVLLPARRQFWVPKSSTRSPRHNGALNSR